MKDKCPHEQNGKAFRLRSGGKHEKRSRFESEWGHKYNTNMVVSKFDENRERHEIDEESWGDYTSKGPWTFKDQEYTYVTEERTDGDGEWWRVIVKRTSDGKYFELQWGYSHGSGNYFYEEDLIEVFPKVITTTTYE